MELKPRFLPPRLFWASYPGIALFGLGGAAAFAGLGTAMLLFRPLFEPWAPIAVGLVISFMTRGRYAYGNVDYVWIVVWVYAAGVTIAGASAWSAYLKPKTDRKVDAYLQRKLALDDRHVSHRDPRSD
jgi:hypothetical protein